MEPTNNPVGSETTLLGVLQRLSENGYTGHLIAQDDATVRCTECEGQRGADFLTPDGFRRLEGASDAADLSIVVWSRCPACDQAGVLTLGYGPNASEADAAVLAAIDLVDVPQPGKIPI